MEYYCGEWGLRVILLFGNDKLVADWMSKKWGHSIPPWYYAIGIIDPKTGLLRGAASFHNYNGANIEISYYGPNTFSRDVIRGISDFCINKIKVERLTVSVPRKSKSMLRTLPRFGFKVEGVLRHFYGPYKRDDAIIFGMLASEGRKFL